MKYLKRKQSRMPSKTVKNRTSRPVVVIDEIEIDGESLEGWGYGTILDLLHLEESIWNWSKFNCKWLCRTPTGEIE